MTADSNTLADQLLELHLSENPMVASLYGLPGHDEELADLSVEAEQANAAAYRRVAEGAASLGLDGLSETERQSVDFIRLIAEISAEVASLGTVEWTITDLFISPAATLIHQLPQLPLTDAARSEAYRIRLSRIPSYLATAADRHRQGIASGRTPVARLVRSAISHLDRVLHSPDLAGVDRDGTTELVDELVRPALSSYRDALSSMVLEGRDDDHPGLCHLPGGEEIYATLARAHTSGEHLPADLHAIGLEITAQLEAEYSEIGGRCLGESRRAAIFDRLRNDPALRYDTSEEMIDQAGAAVGRAEAALPDWFATVADDPCLIEAVPPADAAGSPPAYYLPGALDGSRRGTYFLNTSSPRSRLRHTAEAFAFHEAVPGHHLQQSLAQQASGLPTARRVISDTATTEGWGLYAERLADEMGLYGDDVSRLGMLTADSWRAGRLVVDTGMHALGWSRSRAVDWLTENSPMPLVDVETEIDRYIAMPGQALAYMVGRLEIQAMRRRATARLGESFDLRQFHDFVLRAGSLPLSALSASVGRWVEAQAG